MDTVTLRTYNGRYLCAEDGGGMQGRLVGTRPGGLLVANREDPGEWEHFTVVPVGPVQIALKSSLGFYVCAEGGGGGQVVANRGGTSPGPWETFTVHGLPDGKVALQAHNNQFLCAEGGGGGVLVANRTAIGPWETFTPSKPLLIHHEEPEAATGILGPLRIGRGGLGDVLVDDQGDVLAVFYHHGAAFSDFVHGKESEAEDGCKLVRQAGFLGIRPFCVLGYYDQARAGDANQWKAWVGKEVTPIPFRSYSEREIQPTANYYGRYEEFVMMLHSLGLRLMHDQGDMVAWSDAQAIEHMRQIGRCYARLGTRGRDTLAGLWACNEGWQNLPGRNPTPELCVQMLRAFRDGSGGWWPAVRGLSCPTQASEEPADMDAWSVEPATVITVHGSRSVNEHLLPHYFGYGAYYRPRNGRIVWNTEPIGPPPETSVGVTDDLEVLTALAALALISGQAWTHMGNVFGKQRVDQYPGFREVGRIAKWLPKNLMHYDKIGHSGTSFSGTRILEAPGDQHTAEFAIHSGTGHFAMVIHGLPPVPMKVLRSCRDFRVINLVSDQVERDGPLTAGTMFSHPMRRARLVTGQLS